DYGSIQKLKSKTNMFFVPLGVGAHFMEWGINESQITEMNWWETNRLDNMEFSFTPSRHFSGRGLTDRNTTLWGSWVIKGKNENLFFSGDGGYGPHFKKIGEKFGPFDLALIECGQYNEKWSQIHMMPEQSAQAGLDLKAMFIMPIHWGAFTLAMHSWTDPVIRIKVKAEELGIPIITPKIGGQIEIKALDNPKYQKEWWVN
ncbi:MAG: MBL fold metallo-hydrolase, partial [Salibacteraceae bacterium]